MMDTPSHKNRLKRWWCRHVPGTFRDGHLVFDESTWLQGLSENYWRFIQWMPLLTLLRPSWWRDLKRHSKTGYPTCDCGRTWFKYCLLPALVGSRRFGGGC